ncbi:PH domain-containing protein [Bacillus cytotoxicus]|uniref:PH domain-containing protein n=1 Tax=Bacillus cereus group TaxID=86661 RepID=UPI001AEDC66E|nr:MULTISPECIES: PH domain-containing protein [Bacillus cereus group]QTR72081.1 PH domain-containing protein [Bacillus cytotoxicus]QTR77216.1 PH domain-containing protein [Bacillus cytotoxicus]HDR4570979.1 PH domain-containing protein [Bacillus cytotoxicus]HDR4586791.1 PH domain-containing protein [Bacillus cytotoxicus]
MDKLPTCINQYLECGEKILAYTNGLYEIDTLGFPYKYGFFIATDKKIIFYTNPPLFPAIMEEFSYKKTYFVASDDKIMFRYVDDFIKAKWIQMGGVKKFREIIKTKATFIPKFI